VLSGIDAAEPHRSGGLPFTPSRSANRRTRSMIFESTRSQVLIARTPSGIIPQGLLSRAAAETMPWLIVNLVLACPARSLSEPPLAVSEQHGRGTRPVRVSNRLRLRRERLVFPSATLTGEVEGAIICCFLSDHRISLGSFCHSKSRVLTVLPNPIPITRLRRLLGTQLRFCRRARRASGPWISAGPAWSRCNLSYGNSLRRRWLSV